MPEPVDVALVLEGTYPYVAGGVSSWVHGLISGMPDLSFGLINLVANYSDKKTMKYQLPSNVKYLLELSVYDTVFPPVRKRGDRRGAWKSVRDFSFDLQEGRIVDFDALYRSIGDPENRALDMKDLTSSREAWDVMIEVYREKAPEISFVDFFWTWRYSHFPIFQMLFAEIPPAKVYHTICTGWAGLVAVIAKKRFDRPLLLTKHGIYTNERRIEISQAAWIYTQKDDNLTVRRDLGYFKQLWINIFQSLGHLTYDHCDAIYTLYGGNKRMQISFGAPAAKISVIPNGVKIQTFSMPRAEKKPEDPMIVGFVGRVVPIKDVKTFLRASKILVEKFPQVEIHIIGPYDEDRQYFEECQALVDLLGLKSKVMFKGKVNVREYYPRIDVLVLTSVSEGQPLVILEGYCCKVPVVATDVGACSELILGQEGEDASLGPAGIVTRVGNPQETAEAILRILQDDLLRESMGMAALERVKRYYDYDEMIRRYKDIYLRFRNA